jgi:hypothetical protein
VEARGGSSRGDHQTDFFSLPSFRDLWNLQRDSNRQRRAKWYQTPSLSFRPIPDRIGTGIYSLYGLTLYFSRLAFSVFRRHLR